MSTASIPQVAVLGCGYWGKNLVRNFHQLGALAMVCDPAEVSRAKAQEIAPGVQTTAAFEEAFSREDLDAVVIATPAETHEPLALAAIAAGKDVFVEKPMALTLEGGQRMKAAAEAAGRILMVGHLLEYHPAVLKLRELIEVGELGSLRSIYSNRLNLGKIRTEENVFWSFAPHDIAVILRFVGETPVEVLCRGESFVTPGIWDTARADLTFSDGLRAHIFTSWLHPFKEQRLVVIGDKAMAVFDDTLPLGDKLKIWRHRVEVHDCLTTLVKAETEPVLLADEEPLSNECRHFLDCLSDRRQPLTDASNGLAVLAVLGMASPRSNCPAR